MGQVIGYARVSSVGQSLDVQLDKLAEAGAEKVYQEKMSGKSAKDRQQLQAMLGYVREGGHRGDHQAGPSGPFSR